MLADSPLLKSALQATVRAGRRIRELYTTRSWPAAALLAASLLVVGAASARVLDPGEPGPFQESYSDFDDYRRASIRLYDGKDPYNLDRLEALGAAMQSQSAGQAINLFEIVQLLRGVGSYLYPPLTAFLLGPLRKLDYHNAALLFQASSLTALVAFLWLSLRLPELGEVRRTEGLRNAALAMLLCAGLLAENGSNGNIGAWLILLSGGGLFLAFSSSMTAALMGGFMLGIAVTIKITPVFLFVVLFAGRRRAAIAAGFAGIVAGLLLPAMVVGWEENLKLLRLWRAYILKSFNQFVFIRSWANNQSVPGAIGKLFVPYSDTLQAKYGLPLMAFGRSPGAVEMELLRNVARFCTLTLYALPFLAGLALAWRLWLRALLAERRWRTAALTGDWQDLLAPQMIRLSLLATLSAVAGAGVSWRHAYCALLPAALWRIYSWRKAGDRLPRVDRAWLGFIGLFSLGYPLLPGALRDAFAIYSIFLWLAVALCFWLTIGLLRRES
ncbi:MAG: DUF2029 domain-containing protein [Leptospirales bacterium]|nr:DUF2029 domain-containing protein [Leptospirales bacterium]